MSTFLRRLTITFTGLAMIGLGAFFVFKEENTKRSNKISQLEAAYLQNYEDFKNYKKSYEDQVNKIREENKNTMIATKEKYDSVLASQQSLVRSHTRLVAENATPTGGSYTSSSNTSTTTTTVKISKPKSTSTKTS